MIYDINTCLNSLSFIQISVAFNFGCIIMQNNPVVSLFKILTSKSYAKADNYIREFTPKLKQCTDWIQKNDFDESTKEAYSMYSKLMCQHMKTFESMGKWWIKTKQDEPICFSHACLLLGFYGLLGLFAIPLTVGHHAEWATNALALFTNLTILTLLFFFALEVYRLFMHTTYEDLDDEEKKKIKTKYLILEIFLIILLLLTSFVLPLIFSTYDWQNYVLLNNIYDAAIILPYISFIICFLWYICNKIRNKITDKNISKNIKECESLFSAFKTLTGL